MISTHTLFHRLVAALLVFVATVSTTLADGSGTGWSYDSASKTLTLSGSNVDWTAIKEYSSTTEHVLFAEDYAVSSIPQEAFSGFSKLDNIDIPNNVVTSIEQYAFRSCSSLASITLPEGLTSIGDYAFFYCNSLTSISVPEGVTSIGRSVFYRCTSLASISIPEGVTSIGDHAFYYCKALTSISFPASLQSIGDYVLSGCSSLSSVTIPSGLTSIGDYAFENCSSLTSVSIPEGVTSISDYAFYCCFHLASINLPEDVTSIGSYAFYYCSSLTSVSLPASLQSIGEGAFRDCSSLNTVEVLSNGTSDNKHVICLGDSDDKNATGLSVFPRRQATLVYDPSKTWIGDDGTQQNLRYYFNSFASPTSLPTIDASHSTPQYYDLGGHPVSPETLKGIAVKLQDGKASIVSIK